MAVQCLLLQVEPISEFTLMMTMSFSVGCIHKSLQSAEMLTVQQYFLIADIGSGFSVAGVLRYVDPLLTFPKNFLHKCPKSTHKLDTHFFLYVKIHELQESQQRREPA